MIGGIFGYHVNYIYKSVVNNYVLLFVTKIEDDNETHFDYTVYGIFSNIGQYRGSIKTDPGIWHHSRRPHHSNQRQGHTADTLRPVSTHNNIYIKYNLRF